MREHVQEGLLDGTAVDDDAACRGHGDGGNAEENIGDMKEDARAEYYDA